MPQGAEGPSSVRPIARLAISGVLSQDADQHPRERPILLAVDQEVQELSGGHRGSDSARSLLYGVTDSCNEPQDAHHYG